MLFFFGTFSASSRRWLGLPREISAEQRFETGLSMFTNLTFDWMNMKGLCVDFFFNLNNITTRSTSAERNHSNCLHTEESSEQVFSALQHHFCRAKYEQTLERLFTLKAIFPSAVEVRLLLESIEWKMVFKSHVARFVVSFYVRRLQMVFYFFNTIFRLMVNKPVFNLRESQDVLVVSLVSLDDLGENRCPKLNFSLFSFSNYSISHSMPLDIGYEYAKHILNACFESFSCCVRFERDFFSASAQCELNR